MDRTNFHQAMTTIQAEFVDVPDLELTQNQLARLAMLPPDICRAAVAALLTTGFLVETTEGIYARRGTPPVHVEHLDALTWAVTPSLPAVSGRR